MIGQSDFFGFGFLAFNWKPVYWVAFFDISVAGIPPVSPGVLPVSVPYNPSSTVAGGAPSLIIPSGVQPKPQTTNTPSPTNSTPTNAPASQFTVTGSRSDTQSSASSASDSPSTTAPAEPGAVSEQQGAGIREEEEGEDEGQQERDNNRVEPYVDFTDFYRQIAELGEDYVYGWDKDKTEAAT